MKDANNISNIPIVKFYSHKSEVCYRCFSNFYPCTFTMGANTFNCSEQALMFYKAMTFRDLNTATAIMQESDPAKIKKLGRQVTPYDDAVWAKQRLEIMVNILTAKFSQNADLCKALLSTGNAIICECSPTDRVWGIGLAINDARADNVATWRGENLLGKALCLVRAYLQKEGY